MDGAERVACEDIVAGDAIVFLGTPHIVSRIEPYTGPLREHVFATAHAALGWSISLERGGTLDVVRRFP